MNRTVPTGLGLFAAIVAAASCKKGSDARVPRAEEPPLAVESVVVEERPMPRHLVLTGSLVANQESDLAANASGKVIRTSVERGTMVHEGDPIARLDARTATFSASEAAALTDQAKEQHRLAEEECRRAETLYRGGSISRVEYDRIVTECRTRQLAAEAAEARFRQASKAVGDATIRAPFSGLVVERRVSVGEYVSPSTVVAVLVQIDPLRLHLTVPEQQVSLVGRDQAVTFTTAAYPGETFGGIVKFVGPALRGESRDLVVEAIVSNPDGRLRPGMFVTAYLDLGRAPAPAVPEDAIRVEGALRRVFVIVGDHVEERIVQTGESEEGLTAIRDGVAPGERVVRRPPEALTDGRRVL